MSAPLDAAPAMASVTTNTAMPISPRTQPAHPGQIPSASTSEPPSVSAAFESPIQPALRPQNPPSPPLNPNLPVCGNCRTQTTPLWRRAENGTTLCNACSLYQKMKGTPRPVSLKTDVIKHRNRSKGENARKANKAAQAAAQAAAEMHYSQSRGTSHSRTRDGLGSKSGPGGADGDNDSEYFDDDGGDYKRARHGGFYGYVHSPTRQARGISRGRGSRSSSQQRRSESSESRSEGHGAVPQMIPYPIFYYPPPHGGSPHHPQQMPPYPPYGYPPMPPEWAAYMQQMQAQGMAGGMPPGMPPYMMPYAPSQPLPSQPLPGHGLPMNGHGPMPHDVPQLPPMRAVPSPRSQSVDSFRREAERGRSGVALPPLRDAAAGPSPNNGSSAGDGSRTSSTTPSSAVPPQLFHPYLRSGPYHPRPTAAAVSDARTTPPRDIQRPRRTSEPLRPTSSASSSGGSQEGRFAKAGSPSVTVASRAPDAMTIDEVDEAPDTEGDTDGTNAAIGPIRAGPSSERRGRSSTRKPASSMPHDVDERLEKMRMESPLLSATMMQHHLPLTVPTLPPAVPPVPAAPMPDGPGAAAEAAMPAQSTSATGQSQDELNALRMRVKELEMVNNILTTRISELEKGNAPAATSGTSG